MDNTQQTSQPVAATPQDNTVPSQANTEAKNQGQVTPQSAEKPVVEQKQAPEAPKDEGVKPKTEEANKSEVPEKYEFQAPEGVQLDPVTVEEFSVYAKESGLSQEKAQKAVDIAARHFKKLQTQSMEGIQKVREDWKSQMKNHPTLGGDKYEQSLEIAKRGVVAHSDIKGLSDALDQGWGDHPAFMELFHRIGLDVSEDQITHGTAASGEKTVGDLWYGKN